MHELSIAMSLVETVEEVLEREGAKKVIRLSLSIGELSGVEREPLEFCFPLAAEGSSLEGAELSIEEVPVSVCCASCGAESSPELPFLLCPKCSSHDVNVIAGRDLAIKSMEIE